MFQPSFRKVWDHSGRFALLMVLLILCSCDSDFFSPNSKEVANGYRLRRAEGRGFSLTRPQEERGRIIDEIGWSKPLILFRASGSEYWDVIDTAHARHTQITDTQRQSDPIYQSIKIQSAEAAWNGLQKRRPIW